MLTEYPSQTNGPDSRHGLGSCGKCQRHHSGERTGFADSCCCCDPCRYVKSWGIAEGAEQNGKCCRCVPKLITMVFSPDVGSETCCAPLNVISWAENPNNRDSIEYTYPILLDSGTSTVTLKAVPGYGGECAWTVDCEELSIHESVTIDHVDVTCLDAPPIEITGVSINDCIGSLSFHPYLGEKIPFVFNEGETSSCVPITTEACDCGCIPEHISIYGRRHTEDGRNQIEVVTFSWNSDLGDRWEYLPACGDPTSDKEIIYLRGDGYGNCYLEFDFEQSGETTNDWAIPTNTLGENEYEIRDGMQSIPDCNCFSFQSTPSGQSSGIENPRFIHAHSGKHGRWKYQCGTCRCIPQSLCVIGQLDDEFIEAGTLTWDGSGWAGEVGDYNTPIRLYLGNAECPGLPAGRESDDCALYMEDIGLENPLEKSTAIECSEFLTAEMQSDRDVTYGYSWLWATAKLTPDCSRTVCGLCSTERCGGAPDTLYVDLQAIGTPGFPTANGIEFPTTCNLTMPVSKWERFDMSFVPPVLDCGYIGQTRISCPDPDDDFILEISYSTMQGEWRLTKTFISSGSSQVWSGLSLVPPEQWTNSCDPYIEDSGWTDIPVEDCFWGCVLINSIRFTVVE